MSFWTGSGHRVAGTSWRDALAQQKRRRSQQKLGNRKGNTKKLCDKDFAERSGELSGAICLKTLVLLGNDPATPSNFFRQFLRFLGFVSPFWAPEKLRAFWVTFSDAFLFC